jgi:uncharacterized protein YqhQ
MSERETDKLRLGGMALANGLLVHGPTHWAAAVRTPEGEVRVAWGPKPKLGQTPLVARVPGLRGVAKLAEALAVVPLVRLRLPEARLPFEDPRAIAGVVGASLAARAIRRGGPGTVAREAAVAALGLAPAIVTLGRGDLAAYHGAEHKSIGAYEAGADAAETPKEHDRCGSNLVAPLLASTVAGNVAARRAGLRGPLAEAGVALGSAAVAVEVFGWADRHSGTPLARALRRPGHELQRVVGTREPSPEQLEVAERALAALLEAEGAPAG